MCGYSPLHPCLTAAALLACIGCAPKVHRFEVTPSHICPGTPVQLHVEVTGKPTVTTQPPIHAQPTGVYVPATNTHFTLQVRRWFRKKGSETEVVVVPSPDEITVYVQCVSGKLIGTLLDRKIPDWDPRLKVTTVETGAERELVVKHADREARLTPAQPSTDAFKGTSPAGPWTIEAALLAGEICASSDALPHRFFLTSGTACE